MTSILVYFNLFNNEKIFWHFYFDSPEHLFPPINVLMTKYLKISNKMKRYMLFLLSFLSMTISAREAIIYYEGIQLYAVDIPSYEFQSILHHDSKILRTNDSLFLAFLENKIDVAEEGLHDGTCWNATYKPMAMIQIVFVKDNYCYYTLNLSSFLDISYLTIDGKSYVLDKELQEVITEIVKYYVLNQHPVSSYKLHRILDGERDVTNPFWQITPMGN